MTLFIDSTFEKNNITITSAITIKYIIRFSVIRQNDLKTLIELLVGVDGKHFTNTVWIECDSSIWSNYCPLTRPPRSGKLLSNVCVCLYLSDLSLTMDNNQPDPSRSTKRPASPDQPLDLSVPKRQITSLLMDEVSPQPSSSRPAQALTG